MADAQDPGSSSRSVSVENLCLWFVLLCLWFAVDTHSCHSGISVLRYFVMLLRFAIGLMAMGLKPLHLRQWQQFLLCVKMSKNETEFLLNYKTCNLCALSFGKSQ